MFLRVLLLIIFTLTLLHPKAQYSLTGYVLNEKGDSLSFATIKFIPAIGAPAKTYCISSVHGWYSLQLPKDMTKGFLEASAVGYNPAVILLDTLLRSKPLLIKLAPLNKALPEVIVKSEPAIRVSGDTVAFRADAFTRGNERTLGHLLANIPGFVVQENGKINFNGEPIEKILIEGDDLTGRNYETLVKNVSPTGVEKLEVLRNFQDPENIASSLTREGGQVLNLRFKKNFAGHVLGTAEGAVGLPDGNYGLDAQAVSLIRKIKFIALGNANTKGDIKMPAQDQDPFQAAQSREDPLQISLSDNNALAAIDDIRSSYLKKPLIAANNSQQSSINGYLRIGPHLIIKVNSDYKQDNCDQGATTLKNIYTPSQTITVREKQSVNKISRLFSNNLSLNFTDRKHNQLTMVFAGSLRRIQHSRWGILNASPFEDRMEGNNDQYNWKVTAQHIFPKGTALGLALQAASNGLPGIYTLIPAFYDSLFYKEDLHTGIMQREQQKFTSRSARAFLIKQFPGNTATLELSCEQEKDQLFNGIDSVSPGFTNAVVMGRKELNLEWKDAWACRPNLSMTGATDFLYFEYGTRKKTVVLPRLSVNYQLSRLDKFTLSYASENKLPQLWFNAPGLIINGLTAVMGGNDTLRTAVSHSLQLLYAHTDLVNHRLLYFLGTAIQQNPYLYLPSQSANPYYTYSSYLVSQNSMTAATVFGRADKFFSDMHSRISPQLTFTKIHTYNIMDMRKTANTATQLKIGVDFTAGIHTVDLSGGYSYSLLRQHNDISQTSSTQTGEMEVNIGLDWKISSRLFFNARAAGRRIYPPGRQPVDALTSASSLFLRSKNEKWDWGMQCTNLLDQRSYSYSVVTPTQASVQEYALFPRWLAADIRYRF